jgi:hypothetical protein
MNRLRERRLKGNRERQFFDRDRRDMLGLAMFDRPLIAEPEPRNFQEELEEKEVDRLEEKLKYYRDRSDQRRKQREARERSGFNDLLRGSSNYIRFD